MAKNLTSKRCEGSPEPTWISSLTNKNRSRVDGNRTCKIYICIQYQNSKDYCGHGLSKREKQQQQNTKTNKNKKRRLLHNVIFWRDIIGGKDLRSFRSIVRSFQVRSFQSIVRSFHKIVSSFHKKISSFHM